MSTVVQILLIICITVVILSALGSLDKYIETKKPRTFLEIMGLDNKQDERES